MAKYTVSYRTMRTTHDTFFHTYTRMSAQETRHIFLESGRGGRYSFAGIHPFAWTVGKENSLTVYENEEKTQLEGDSLHQLVEWMKQYKTDRNSELPDFQGGAIGFISYDYVRSIERLPSIAKDEHGLPDICFMLFDQWLAFDQHTNQLYFMMLHQNDVSVENQLDEWISEWGKHETNFEEHTDMFTTAQLGEHADEMSVSMDEQSFQSAAEAIRTYISQGDVFQVNLSVRQSKKLKTSALDVYRKVRSFNPSPYMAYMEWPDFNIVSASPELLVKKAGQSLSTRPIAGTRSRGKDEAEDEKLANELIQNEKERAEHVMLVDLERNDLGRVSQYGTVEVNEFMVIEKYSHVMHIVSNVQGQLNPIYNEADVIRAVFPGGTITGAPKVRTMEIIEELEPVRRGLYTGSVGWIGFNGDMELNIVIRTMLVKDGIAHVQAGAGVVIDSHPAREYKESLKKAQALWKAKDLAEGKEENA
ncbi:anthranilate synthase component I family protein [Jeotgalibacillus soli]|uniref:Para-aminobenzoate synthase n=1 Tax=Jeotgalibacillus soli TaxID=889306 RepID=A0A0C2W7J2_9BACL|nr:anthranilate synthase component I family protein [Jeotgalibacillus soli]KIL52536.1 hypothetical protein KP78_00710 [Jeotgalibacillus soli]